MSDVCDRCGLDCSYGCSCTTLDLYKFYSEKLAICMENRRATFDAMCAMRNDINEYIPMPSLESDLLQGPEDSVFCAAVAEAVIAAYRKATKGGVK